MSTLRLTRLGWAGVELAVNGTTIVIDPLEDARAVFAPLGEHAAGTPAPEIVPPTEGAAVAGLVTHLHRDHADAAALKRALVPGAPVLEPSPRPDREDPDDLALLQADHELGRLGLDRHVADVHERAAFGPFTVTALPASDGLGDPQVSWLVEAEGARILHLGDTMNHGGWWRMAHRYGPFDVVLVPVNGATTGFPHRRPPSPLPAALDPQAAAIAARILGAALAVPIHDTGYEVDGVYVPVADAARRFLDEAAALDVPARALEIGEALEVAPHAVV